MESLFNNTKQYLPSLTAWTGRPEVTSGFVNLAVNVITTQDCTLTVYQSTDGSTFDFADQFALPVSVFGNQTRTQFAVKALYVKVNVFNDTLVDISNLIVTTTFSATSQDSSIEQPVIVAGNVTVLNAMKARDYTDNSVREVSCDINGQLKVVPVGTTDVNATNLITETLATRRVDFLVVGNWYRVASVGITSGAQWNAIGAIVDGESVPSIGRLFKCLSIGSAVAGGGECYDVEYTDAVSATISNFPATQAVSGTVSLSDPTSVRIRDAYGDAITTTAGNLMVGINNIYTANPLHTILDSGTVGLSTSANTIKIDQTSISTNGVRTIAPDTFSARVTTAGTTPVEVNEGGHLLSFLAVNTSAVADAYVKLYDSVSAPNSAIDTPLLIAYVSRDAAARLPTLQVSTSNLKITNKLWVRAVTGSADNNTDVTGLSMDICFFGTAT